MFHVIPRPTPAHPGAAWGPAYDHLGLPGTLEAPAELRLWAVRRLIRCGRPYSNSPDLADALRLVASELATNAIRHSASGEDGGFLIAALHFPHDCVTLRVFDLGPKTSAPTSPAEPPNVLDDPDLHDAEHGRGLALIALHARRYGWTRPPRHRVHSVWVELPVEPRLEAA
ncbi:ATP-binding protein [Marinitenerispora sediminis]|uniref:ATP-binding protein n=1 Tax=Marinitenerispora sediminis TaxID=1931232 RepID=A0A368T5M9_9ACTN|nr:ATP-binding protein [Marinitenerispora sediminis]RCV48770.1 ATP-binding protein [Marinitenerispora sediminis]RCV50898.1 ATP-binding protein [Marinitenerispora sediminis]RCV58676.1 ATP-binding protein [Marinitenerispora sediminis]